MPPQSLLKRITRLLSDCATDPTVDVRARWAKIVDDGVGAEAEAALGGIPDVTLDDVDLDTAIAYAARDADATLRVYPVLRRKIEEMGLQRALAIDEAVVPMIVRMMSNGMLVDRDHLATLNYAFDDALADLEYRCHQLVGRRFLLTSGDQVAEVLYGDLNLGGRRKTKSGKRLSTDEKALQALKGSHPVVSLILEHREISKLQSTYVKVLPTMLSPDDRIRMELGLTTIPSGRINCWGGINLQAIPVATELGREIRRAFIAPPGRRLGGVDLSQIELRALAIMSGDERLLDAFARGIDLHAQTAAEAIYKVPLANVTFEQRQEGKRVNFQIPYGISAKGLLEQFILSGIENKEEADCQRMLDSWYDFYTAVDPWMASVYEEGRRLGYIRDTLSGRILYIPGLRSPIDKVREHAERVCIAWKCQTFAQVLMKLGMAQTWEYLQCDPIAEPLLQVHDEELVEFDAGTNPGDTLVELMVTAAPPLPIPIVANWHEGQNWKELK